MVVNHTARWWLDLSVGWPRYHIIYLTLPLSAPLFLFLVGFCLPLSYLNSTVARGESFGQVALRYLRRGALLVPLNWLLTLLVFPEDPLFGGEVLQTIGLSIVGLTPILPFLSRRSARALLLALALGCYATFNLALPSLRAGLAGHPVISEAWFTGFPRSSPRCSAPVWCVSRRFSRSSSGSGARRCTTRRDATWSSTATGIPAP